MSQIIIRRPTGEEIRKKVEPQTPPDEPQKKYDKKGYELSTNPEFTYKHHEVYILQFGYPQKGWHIHHIDRNRENNNIENLIAIPKALHEFIHFRMRKENRTWSRLDVENELKYYLDNERKLQTAQQELDRFKAQSQRWVIPESETFDGQKYKPLSPNKSKLKKRKKTTFGSVITSNGLVVCPKCQSTKTCIQRGQRKTKEMYKCFCQNTACKNIQFISNYIVPEKLKTKLKGEFE